VEVPDVSYAQSGDVAIAYQAVGEGPTDLVFLPFLANIYTLWLAAGFAKFGRRLTSGRRLIIVNSRGILYNPWGRFADDAEDLTGGSRSYTANARAGAGAPTSRISRAASTHSGPTTPST
jgi:hypothetical protein